MDRYNFNDLDLSLKENSCFTRVIDSALHARCRWYLSPLCHPNYQLFYSVRCYASPVFSTKYGDLVFRLLLIKDEASRCMILRPEFQIPNSRPKFCVMKGHVTIGRDEEQWCFDKMDDTMALRYNGFLLEDKKNIAITCHLMMQLGTSDGKNKFLEFYPRGYVERNLNAEILELTFKWSVGGFSTRFPATSRSMIFCSEKNENVKWFLKLAKGNYGKISVFLKFLEPKEVSACFWEIFIVHRRKLTLFPVADHRSWSRHFTRDEWYNNLASYRDRNGYLTFMGRLIVACNPQPIKQPAQFEVKRSDEMKKVIEDLMKNCVDYGVAVYKQRLPDVALMVGDKAIPAHKIVLLSHSPIFFELLMTDFDLKKVKIEGVDYETMSLIIRYIYDGKILVKCDRVASEKLLVAARSFGIKGLKLALEERFLKDMKLDNVVGTLKYAVTYKADNLRERALVFLNDNLEKLELQQYREVTELSTQLMLALVLKKFEKNDCDYQPK